jgi:16S rRNA (guanine527-N7)-methyltransferase
MIASDLAEDRERALALTPVSRETAERLDRLVALLLTWQRTTQLVANSTLPQLWTRHIADSLQLLSLAPEAQSWVDLGSGAGFPGLVIACRLPEASPRLLEASPRLPQASARLPQASVRLIESNAKKAAFLREAVRATDAPAEVHHTRIENFVDSFDQPVDVVTARALAPLKLLLDRSQRLLRRGAIGIFPKGQDVDGELTEASKYWNMQVDLVPSVTDSKGRIVIIRGLQPQVVKA